MSLTVPSPELDKQYSFPVRKVIKEPEVRPSDRRAMLYSPYAQTMRYFIGFLCKNEACFEVSPGFDPKTGLPCRELTLSESTLKSRYNEEETARKLAYGSYCLRFCYSADLDISDPQGSLVNYCGEIIEGHYNEDNGGDNYDEDLITDDHAYLQRAEPDNPNFDLLDGPQTERAVVAAQKSLLVMTQSMHSLLKLADTEVGSRIRVV